MDASRSSYSIVDNLMYVLHDLSVCIIISCFVHQCEIIVQENNNTPLCAPSEIIAQKRYPRYASWCSYRADNMV